MRRNLRLRVATGTAVLAMVIVLVHSAILLSAFEQLEDALVDGIVTEQLQHFIVNYRNNPSLQPEVSALLKGYVANDAASRAALPDFLRALSPGVHDVLVAGREHHVALRDEPDGRFVMTYDVGQHNERELRFIAVIVVGVGVTLLGAAALGYWAAGLLVRPVHQLAQRVDSLGATQLAAPLANEFQDEDVLRLARAFDGYRKKVAELILREQEFTANVSHELRTPLTSIRTSCELLLQERELEVDERRRIESIDRAAERLTAAAQSLLFLARGDRSAPLEEVSVRECVEEAAEPIRSLLARKNVTLEMSIHPAAFVRAQWHALYLVASNLIRNAASYTDHGSVAIAYRDGALAFKDSGPGIHASELPRVFERFHRGTGMEEREGWGLGLSIVKRICESFDWDLEIASAPGRGTQVTVRFPLPASQEVHAMPTRF